MTMPWCPSSSSPTVTPSALSGTTRGKHKSSGEPAVVKMVLAWTMDGGKAVAFQQYVDTIRVRELS